MLPFWNHTLTLIHRVESKDESGKTHVSFIKETLKECFWKESVSTSLVGNTVVYIRSVTCRVPSSQMMPNVGDALFDCNVECPISNSELNDMVAKNQSKSCRVKAVTDNAKFTIPHYSIKGE